MYNKVIIVGHLTRDIELKHIPSGTAIASSSIATSYKYGDREDTCFLEFSAFGKQGEILAQYVRKGSKILLDGRLVFEQWNAQDGSKRSRHSLRVETFKFLESKGNHDGSASSNSGSEQNNYNNQAPSNNAPAQNNYNNNAQQQAPSHTQNNVANTKTEELPSINIDDDEIPF